MLNLYKGGNTASHVPQATITRKVMSTNKRKFQLTVKVESVGPRTRKKMAEMKKYGENMTTENNLCELIGG